MDSILLEDELDEDFEEDLLQILGIYFVQKQLIKKDVLDADDTGFMK